MHTLEIQPITPSLTPFNFRNDAHLLLGMYAMLVAKILFTLSNYLLVHYSCVVLLYYVVHLFTPSPSSCNPNSHLDSTCDAIHACKDIIKHDSSLCVLHIRRRLGNGALELA